MVGITIAALGQPVLADVLALVERCCSVVPRCRSFSADTQVLLGDGTTTHAISELEVGDGVWAHDPETGMSGRRQVEAVWPHYDWLLDLDVDGGSVTTTEDHHFWNATDQQWQESQDIDRGDDLLAAEGNRVDLEGLEWSTRHYAWISSTSPSKVSTPTPWTRREQRARSQLRWVTKIRWPKP